MTLKVLKSKGVPFETSIIERYRRRESSVEEALIGMCLAGVPVQRVEDSYRKVLGAAEGMREDKARRIVLFQWQKSCGLGGVKLFVGALHEKRLKETAVKAESGIEETLTYADFPFKHWT